MNSVQLIGRLTHDPRTTQAANGATVVDLRVAVDRPADGTDFVTVKAWDRLAETAATYLARGRRIAVSGRLRHDEWTDDGGQRLQRLTVTADRIEFLDQPPTSKQETDRTAMAATNGPRPAE